MTSNSQLPPSEQQLTQSEPQASTLERKASTSELHPLSLKPERLTCPGNTTGTELGALIFYAEASTSGLDRPLPTVVSPTSISPIQPVTHPPIHSSTHLPSNPTQRYFLKIS